ncbi:MAG TPA: zinc-binding dehydrogenase, partial [Solirubrobacteraceae bacterium]|nr:zinc-binding dehydrogenase [Solirubrobacteraceae bacterium]
MRALVSCTAPPHAELADVAEPSPLPHEAVVSVRALSLNRGEVRRLERLEPGTIAGWDLAGTVSRPAADGSGPQAGARVVGLKNAGAWAEQVAVSTEFLAELPDGISFEQAATLPVAGLTALRALEIGGFVLGKRVLITGASGGVGHFALQLASLAGAHVTGVARRTEGLRELGADELLSQLSPGDGKAFDVILDAIGGPVLGAALQCVAPRGTVVSFAATVTEPVTYPTRELFSRAPGAVLHGLYIFDELDHTRTASSDLRRLADLVAAGRVDPQISLTVPWTQAAEAIEALLDRRVAGKAVL